MAIAGAGGWIPSVRVCIARGELELCGYMHNVPPEVVWMPEDAAGHFYDNPKAFIYVPTSEGGGTVYLAELLREMGLTGRKAGENELSDTTEQGALPPLVSDLDIMNVLESVLINDEVVNVLDAHEAMVWLRDKYEAERATLAAKDARISELEAILKYIDDRAPRSDDTCIIPGLTLSQAARNALMEKKR